MPTMLTVARRRRWTLRAGGIAVIVAMLVGGLAGCGGTRTPAEREGNAVTGANVLSLNGLTLTVPGGWDSEAFYSKSGMSILRLGSFAFPHRPDDDVGQIAREHMTNNDVLINIVDYTDFDPRDDTFRPVTPPLSIDGSQATGQEGYYVPAIIDSVLVANHKLYLSIAFGHAPPSDRQVAAANAVLATLSGY